MDDLLRVRGSQRRRDLPEDPQRARLVAADAADALDVVAQALPAQELHHDVRAAVVDVAVEHLDDAGVLDHRRRARLGEEAADQLGRVAEVAQQEFDRRLARDVLVLGEIDLAHAPLTELFD